MRHIVHLLAVVMLVTGLTGCSYVFYPRAGEYIEQAKGASGVETLLNLTTMMEASAKAAKGGTGYDQPLNDLHNQFHAFDKSLCCLDKTTRELPAYALAVTHNKELMAIFKRLWKFKDDQPQRDQHLDLFATEVRELRETLQTLK
jgi:alkylhydroperoxidase/carboxymuconolactone decarboxylase family protein YurZ